MQAEERYGRGGYICEYSVSSVCIAVLTQAFTDVGNGEYQPAPGYAQPGIVPPGQPNYGATGGNYVH